MIRIEVVHIQRIPIMHIRLPMRHQESSMPEEENLHHRENEKPNP